MTVEELIDILSTMPKESKVIIERKKRCEYRSSAESVKEGSAS